MLKLRIEAKIKKKMLELEKIVVLDAGTWGSMRITETKVRVAFLPSILLQGMFNDRTQILGVWNTHWYAEK